MNVVMDDNGLIERVITGFGNLSVNVKNTILGNSPTCTTTFYFCSFLSLVTPLCSCNHRTPLALFSCLNYRSGALSAIYE